MELKTKNRLTVFLLMLLAIAIYLYALPDEVFKLLIKAIKAD
jgi:hypothetical protein